MRDKLGGNTPGWNVSIIMVSWSTLLVGILLSSYPQGSLPNHEWETWRESKTYRELSVQSLCLALNSHSHIEHIWAVIREQGEFWRLNCHPPQREKCPEIAKMKILLWSSDFFTSKLFTLLSCEPIVPLRFFREKTATSPVIKILPELSIAVESNLLLSG